MIVSDFRAPLATRSTYERSTPNRVRPLLTPAIFTLSQGVYFWHRAFQHSATEELLNRAKDLIRQNRAYLEHFNAVIDQLHKREEEFQAEHPPWGTRYS